jgi:hypothetical protein
VRRLVAISLVLSACGGRTAADARAHSQNEAGAERAPHGNVDASSAAPPQGPPTEPDTPSRQGMAPDGTSSQGSPSAAAGATALQDGGGVAGQQSMQNSLSPASAQLVDGGLNCRWPTALDNDASDCRAARASVLCLRDGGGFNTPACGCLSNEITHCPSCDSELFTSCEDKCTLDEYAVACGAYLPGEVNCRPLGASPGGNEVLYCCPCQ